MRNRQLVAKWAYEKGKKDIVIEFVKKDGKTFVKVNDYQKLRVLFGELLKEIQKIKSEGDFKARSGIGRRLWCNCRQSITQRSIREIRKT